MRIALGVPRVTARWQDNLTLIERLSAGAARAGAQLIVFSEAALTGFVNTGDPAADLALGQTVPGPASGELARMALENGLWIAAGMFERDGERLYDSALLFAPDGALRLRYRRIDPHWHHWFDRPDAPTLYAQGNEIGVAATPLGRCSFLLCGDLFNAAIQQQLAQLRPDWLLFPMARGWDDDVADEAQWYAEERYCYIRAARRAGVGLVLVNQLADLGPGDRFFGGAMVVSKHGAIVAEQPLEQDGVLLVDLEAA